MQSLKEQPEISIHLIKKIFRTSILVLLFGSPLLIRATDYYFSGIGHWTSSSNWTPEYPGGTIGSGDKAFIKNGSYLIIPPGFTVHNDGDIIIFGEVYNSSGILRNEGHIRVHLGEIYNEGAINNYGEFYNDDKSIIKNHGDIYVGSKGLFINYHADAELLNYGNISNEGHLGNNGILHNYSNNFNNLGYVINERYFYNHNDITNYDFFHNTGDYFIYGRFFNPGRVLNNVVIHVHGSFVNDGVVDNYFGIVIECTGTYSGDPPNHEPLIYASSDQDKDGYDAIACGGTDCDDLNNAVYPGAPELCDGLDSDCSSGGIPPADEIDDDGDGYSECEGDCNDNNPLFNPGMVELCDGMDNNCDGVVPDTEIDNDGDLMTECQGDCDDTNINIYSGGPELCDGKDSNCDGIIPTTEIDDDGDGYSECEGDCDDTDNTIFPGAPEICDKNDNNCDNEIPESEIDDDGDGYTECEGDCDDSNPDIHPDAIEVCDGIDNNCDGIIYSVPGLHISKSELPDFCQGGVLVLTANANTPVTYKWSTNKTDSSIKISGDGVYRVTVTNPEGCIAEASTTISGFDGSTLLSSYIVLASQGVSMHQNTVFNGGVGVTGVRQKARFDKKTMITSLGTFVKAPILDLKGGSIVGTFIADQATVSSPLFKHNPYSTINDIKIISGTTVVLSDSIYGKVEVKDGATAIFEHQRVYMKGLKTKKNTTLKFAGCAEILVSNKVDMGESTKLNPDSNKITFYVRGTVKIGRGSDIVANIYSRDKIEAKKASLNKPTMMTGMFIADKVNSNDHVEWYWNTDCGQACNAVVENNLLTRPSMPVGKVIPGYRKTISDRKEVSLIAYPNPFKDRVIIKFRPDRELLLKLEIRSLDGRIIRTLFEGVAEKGQVYEQHFDGRNLPGGMYFYRILTESGESYNGKLMLSK